MLLQESFGCLCFIVLGYGHGSSKNWKKILLSYVVHLDGEKWPTFKVCESSVLGFPLFKHLSFRGC